MRLNFLVIFILMIPASFLDPTLFPTWQLCPWITSAHGKVAFIRDKQIVVEQVKSF